MNAVVSYCWGDNNDDRYKDAEVRPGRSDQWLDLRETAHTAFIWPGEGSGCQETNTQRCCRTLVSYHLPFLLPLPPSSSPPRHWTLTPWSSLWLLLNISIHFCLSGSPSDLPGWARERPRFAWRAVEWILYTVIYKWRTCLEVSVHMNTRSPCTPLFLDEQHII